MPALKEKLWQGFGMALGAVVSWPSVTECFGILPDFTNAVQGGSGAGFILGLFLFASSIVQRHTASWRSAWRLLLFVLVAALWLYLNWTLSQAYDASLEQPNITTEALNSAKLAVFSLSVLWSVPLTYIGGLLGEAVAGAKGMSKP